LIIDDYLTLLVFSDSYQGTSKPERQMKKVVNQIKAEIDMIEGNLASEGFVSINQAAKFLSLSRGKIYLMLEAGQLSSAKFGRARRIAKRSLLEVANKSIVAAR
jgi:excisionase family DNA binding protein